MTLKPLPGAVLVLFLLGIAVGSAAAQAPAAKPESGPAARIFWGDISAPWLTSTAPNCIAFRPGDRQRIFVGTCHEGLLTTPDGGGAWYRDYIDFYIDEFTPSWWIRDVLFSAADPADGLAVTMAGSYWTDDGGIHWYALSWPCPMMSHMAADSPSGDTAVVSDYGGSLWIYHWKTRTFDMPITVPGAAGCLGISFDASSPSELYIATVNASVWKTPDLGQTLIRYSEGLPNTVAVVAADPVTPGLVLAAAGSDLYTTRPTKGPGGGRRPVWFPLGSGLPGTDILCLVHDPRDPKRIYAGTMDNGIYLSLDGGETWSPFDRNWIAHRTIIDLEINAENPAFLIAAGHSGNPDAGGVYKIPISR